MHPFSFLLAFAAAALAIDVRFMKSKQCKGWAAQCQDVEPHECCWIGSKFAWHFSGVFAVPKHWNIEGRAHEKQNCDLIISWKLNEGGDTICLGASNVYSTSYVFDKVPGADPRSATNGTGKCREVDSIRSEEGAVYDIRNMAEDTLDELIELANNGTAAADIPETFHSFRIES